MQSQSDRSRHEGAPSAASAVLLSAILATVAAPAAGQVQETTVVSVSSTGQLGNDDSVWPSISADGRFVAFQSHASNLVPGDGNAFQDIFVHDRQGGQTTRVNVGQTGNPANNHSARPWISADGWHVAWETAASNLVPGDTNFTDDIFVRDRQSGQTIRVSVSSTGAQGNRSSRWPSISGDGRHVAFESEATNLVAGDTNNQWDIFVHDRLTTQTRRVNVSSSGGQAFAHSYRGVISVDGRSVAFVSLAPNLVPGDHNQTYDVFVHDLQSSQTTRASVNPSNGQGSGEWCTISADGRFVAFRSNSSQLVGGDENGHADVFVTDMLTGEVELVSVSSSGEQGNLPSAVEDISGDGRYVSFRTRSTNLIPGASFGGDVYVHDRQTGRTTRANVSTAGEGSSAGGGGLSDDGRHVAFATDANGFVPGDDDFDFDVFVHDRGCGAGLVAYCVGKVNSDGCRPAIGWSGFPSASAGGGFELEQTNHTAGKFALVFYSTSGPHSAPFQGGSLCVRPPVRRTPGSLSTATGGTACGQPEGRHTFDFDAWVAGGSDPALTAGQGVWAQWWGRDVPGSSSLSNALSFDLCP